MDNSRSDSLSSQPLQSRSLSIEQDIATVLIVDDSESDRVTYSRYLQSDSEKTYRIIEAETLEEGLELWRSQQPDIVLIDLNLPDGDGLEFLEAINVARAGEGAPVIMLTGLGNEKKAVRAMKLGAADYLVKADVTAKLLTIAVRQVLRETLLGAVQTDLVERKRVEALLLDQQEELENRNDLLERTSADLECTVEELRVITEEQVAQHRQLEYEQERYQNLFDFAPDGYLVTDLLGNILNANQAILELLATSREFVLGKPLVVFVVPDNRDFFYTQLYRQVSPTTAKTSWEITLRNHQRDPFPAEITVIQNINLVNNQTQLFWMIRDISDRKRAEQALQELNQSLETKVIERTQELWKVNKLKRAILDGTDYAIISTDLNGIIQTFNAGAEKMFGYSMGEVVGKVTPEIFYDSQEVLDKIVQASTILGKDLGVGFGALMSMASQGLIDEEWTNIRKDGSRFPASVSVTVLKDDNEQPIGILSVRRDISDRKQAELQLQETTDRLALALKSGEIGCWEWNITNNTIVWDERVHELHGIPLGTIVSFDDWANSVHPDDLQSTQSLVNHAIAGEAEFNTEYRVVHPDQSIHFIKGYGFVIRDIDGNPLKMTGVNFDISASKLAEKSLKQQLATIEAAIDGIAILQNNKYIYLNQSHVAIFGYDRPDELLDKSWTELYSSEEMTRFEQEIFPVLQRDLSWQGEAIATRKDGSTFNEGLSLTIAEDGLLICVCRDISDHKQAEIALQSSEDRFRRVFDSSVVGMLFADFQGHIIDANNRFLEMVGYTREDFQTGAIDWLTMTPPEYLEKDYACMEYLIKHRQIAPWEKEYYRKDGSRISIIIGAALLQGTNNETICVILDISERKQAEIQLQSVNQELLRATRLKDEFLANMSHELRTPLNSILGLSESLQDEILGSLNEKQLKAISTIESSGEHLLSLINDILDLSKISSGTMELDFESVLVRNLCDSSLNFVKQQAFKKSIQINSNIPPLINYINIDERRIKQVLINLLTNSVKFTPIGGNVSLIVAFGSGNTWHGEAKIPQQIKTMNSPTIVFQVVDTGIGIASKDLRLLFQPFIQVDSALNRQYEGTGLGLALVKQIVELHGGQVMAESEVGQGSCFTVALPYEISQSNAIASLPTSTTASSQNVNPDNASLILLAEDNEANIQTFSSYLTAINYHVILARNGVEAVAQAKANLPDIILMDIQMPTMDGLEATRQIRLDPNLNSIPIIALTALAMEGDRERCLAAGMNGYISKPLKLKQLARQIAELLAVQ